MHYIKGRSCSLGAGRMIRLLTIHILNPPPKQTLPHYQTRRSFTTALTPNTSQHFKNLNPKTLSNMRGDETKLKVVLKGNHDNFLVFVDDADTYRKWLSDRSIPLAHFISSFKVFVTGQ